MAAKSKKPAYHQVARKPVHPDPLVQQWIESNPKTLFIAMLKQADDTPDPLEKQRIYDMLNEFVRPNLHRPVDPFAPNPFSKWRC